MRWRALLWSVCAWGCSGDKSVAPSTPPSPPATGSAVVAAAPVPADAHEATPVERGERLYQAKGCVGCHSIDGSPRVGPSWKGLWDSTVKLSDGRVVRFDAAWVRRSVLEPTADVVAGFPAAMPSFAGKLRDQDIEDLIAFFQSLR